MLMTGTYSQNKRTLTRLKTIVFNIFFHFWYISCYFDITIGICCWLANLSYLTLKIKTSVTNIAWSTLE